MSPPLHCTCVALLAALTTRLTYQSQVFKAAAPLAATCCFLPTGTLAAAAAGGKAAALLLPPFADDAATQCIFTKLPWKQEKQIFSSPEKQSLFLPTFADDGNAGNS